MPPLEKPLMIITGASGKIGSSLIAAFRDKFTLVGLGRSPAEGVDHNVKFDLASYDSVAAAAREVKDKYGAHCAAIIHLAGYYDFTGEDTPLYKTVNVDGTRNFLKAFAEFEVERFIYASSMLVHEPSAVGRKITEDSPLAPSWAYPKSKAEAEAVIKNEAAMPYAILRIAGVYDEQTAVPTLSQQIARIYEYDFQSYVYAGEPDAGQAFIHSDDLIAALIKVVERRRELPQRTELLLGEEHSMSYEALQNRLGSLIHGEAQWQTISVPSPLAKVGAWAQAKAEPLIPDDFDHGEKPFIRPFMIDLAGDHYELDCSRAKQLLDWQPQHDIYRGLEHLTQFLKQRPLEWYEQNHITAPDWMQEAAKRHQDPAKLQRDFERGYRQQHGQFIWAHFAVIGFGSWLLTSPPLLGYNGEPLAYSDYASGALLMIFGACSLSARAVWARLVVALLGLWVLFAPLVFWTSSAAGYLNSTLVGMIVMGLALASRPSIGVSPVAALTGPSTPPGWSFNPSSWMQRVPIILLAFVGLYFSRYMTAYQLESINNVWDPFFLGAAQDPQNGTEEIITSSVSEAWPVPDAGVGALTYALEIVTGLMGSTRRWRTMPWLVLLFGFMIVPLGVVSVGFIIIQPIMIGTWCAPCLIAATAMLVQIPYSLDELTATIQFLRRRHKAGRPVLKILFVGDTDDGPTDLSTDNFRQPAGTVIKDCLGGGITLPWNLLACLGIGVWLMCTRLTVDSGASLANWEHFVGAVVLTIAVTALAEVGRPVRLLIAPLAIILLVVPFAYETTHLQLINDVVCGLLLIGLCVRRGPLRQSYGNLTPLLHKV